MSTIILKLDDDFISFNNSLSMDWEKTDFPKKYCRFHTNPIYFEAEQLHYNKESRTLAIRVINYTSTKIEEFKKQNPKYPIEWLEIDKMDWQKFKSFLYSFNAQMIRYYFYNAEELFNNAEDTIEETKFRLRSNIQSLHHQGPNSLFQQDREPVIENIQTIAKIKFEEAKFYNGKIGFTAKLKKNKITREFFIVNEFLKEEFEYIKPWIIKKLGIFFLASINIKLVNGEIEEASAGSDEIDQINADLIESIRILKVAEFFKNPAIEKLLYNHDDVLSVVNESDGETNVLNASASDILEIMVRQGIVRNVRQLEFLSKDKQSLNDKLRFTAKPHFGFVFKVDGITKQFFIWELLNTHATYVWERDANEKGFDDFIQNEISLIKTNGREKYRRYYKNLGTKDFRFHLIEHEGADLSAEERFLKWREKVEAITSKN